MAIETGKRAEDSWW